MKRLMACVLALALALTLIPGAAFAAGTATVAASSGSAKPGEQVTITVYATTSDALFGGGQIDLKYDNSTFSVVAASSNNATLQSENFTQTVATPSSDTVRYLSYMGVNPGDEGVNLTNEALFTVTFEVQVGASAGIYPITLTNVTMGDDSEGSMATTSYDGTITVIVDATGVLVNGESATSSSLNVGEYADFTASFAPTGATSTNSFTWTATSGSDLVELSATSGSEVRITAKEAGTAVVRVTSGELTYAEITFTITLNTMTGSVSIDGTPQYGQTLTANTSGTPEVTLTYQWTQDGANIPGATNSTYVITSTDLGKTLNVIVGAQGYTTITAASGVTAAAADMPGSIEIIGDAYYGGTLIVSSTDLPEGVSYQWNYEGAAMLGATGSTYVVTNADIGANITVTASKDYYNSKTSAAVVPTKADQVPVTPTVLDIQDTTATLQAIPGAKFLATTTSGTPATDTDGWQDSNSFTGLTPSTLYYFFMYYPETSCYFESAVGAPATATTLAAERGFSITPSGSGSVGKDLADPIREGDTVTIYATPSSADYKFTGWAATGTTLASTSSRSTTLTVGSDDIEIIGSFAQKDTPPLAVSTTNATYDGTVKSITVFTSLDADQYQVCYYSDFECTQLTTSPTNAGVYYAKAYYTATDDDSGYRSYTTGVATLTITQQQEATPAVPTLSSKTSSIIAINAEVGCRYQILPAASASDELEAGNWDTAGGTVLTFTDLTPGTAYQVWAQRLASDGNYTDSELSSTGASNEDFITDNTYGFTVTPDTLRFFVRTGGTWTSQVVTITNTGSAALTLTATDLSADYDLSWSGTALAAGGFVTVTITPKASTAATMSDYVVATGTVLGISGSTTVQHSLVASYKVADKNEVIFEGVPAIQSVVYNAGNQAPDVSGITAYGLDELGTRTDFTNGDLTFTFASQTNVGTQTVLVTYADDNFEGSASFTFEITPAPITISATPTAVNRVYDGTMDVTLTGGSFTGNLGSDTISVAFPTSGTYGSADAGAGKTVSYDAFTLNNNVSGNYMFASGTDTHPAITGTVEKKPVTPTVTASNKVYDGTTAATLTALVPASDIISGDAVTVTYGGATFNSANAGSVSVASLGTRIVEGSGSANYEVAEVATPSTLTATIAPRPLLATMSDMLSEVYNGQPHTATNVTVGAGCGSDNLGIVYQYEGGATPPTLAGTYTLSAVATNTNYSLSVATATMVISKATLTPATYTSSIQAGNTEQHAVSVTDFGISATALAQCTSILVATPTGDDIFASAPALSGEGTAIVFTLKAGALAGQSANAGVQFTFNTGTYEQAWANLTVNVASDTVLDGSVYLEGTPTSITVGDPIPLSASFTINATFEEAGEQSYVITDADLNYVVPSVDGSGYYATSELGEKTVTVTKNVTVGGASYTLTASFQMQVTDELTDVALSLPVATYERFADTELDFTGATVTPIYLTGEASPVDLSVQNRSALFTTGVTLTDALRPGTHTLLLTTDIDFNTAASDYMLSAAYTYNTVSASDLVSGITVTEPTVGGNGIAVVLATATNGEATPTSGTGSGSAFAVLTGVGANLAFKKVPGGTGATPGDITFNVTSPSAGEQSILDLAVANAIAAGKVVSGSDMAYIVASLTDEDGDPVVMEDGSLRITLPYPAGAGSTDTFVLVHTPLQPDGTTTATDAHIITDVVKGSITFVLSGPGPVAITWAPTQTPPSGDDNDDDGYYVIGGGTFTAAELDFWNRVTNALYAVGANGVVYANAGIYDKMPTGVLTAIRNTGSILSLTWAGGGMVIDRYNAPGYDVTRAYYPLSYLQTILGTLSATTISTLNKTTKSSRNAISIGVPKTGDEEEAIMNYVPTPADAGIITAVPGKNATLTADIVGVVQNDAAGSGVLIGWMLVLLSVTAAAAYVVMKRKHT